MSPDQLRELFAAGEYLYEQEQLESAAVKFEEVWRLTASRLGQIRVVQNDWVQALPYLEVAARNADDLDAQYLLARAYRLHCRFEDAVRPMQSALRGMSIAERRQLLDQPEGVEAITAICEDLRGRQGRFQECVEIYELALEASPANPALLNNLAVAYSYIYQFDKAAEILRRLIELDELNFLARCNLGMCYVRMSRLDEAIAEFEECDRMGYDGSEALGGLLEQKSTICDWDGMDPLRERIVRALDDPTKSQHVALTILQLHFDDPGKMLHWTRRIASRAYISDDVVPFNCSSVGREGARIRIGYFSPHFYDNPVAHLTAALFSLHDRDNFEIFIYAYGPDDGHPVRKRIASEVEHFLDLQGYSEQQLAERIHSDEIDILVDLSANLGWAKPKTLAYRAAPIQVNWLGFIGTMGVEFYDYIIADNFSVPEGFDGFFSEKIVRMPHTFQIADNRRPLEFSKNSRQEHGLPEDCFVFSNCGMLFKIQPEMFAIWVNIMRRVPNAVLWLLKGHPSAERNLRNEWRRAGLAQERLVMSPRVATQDHLARIGLANIFLDTWPCGSGATANDVLWAGLPMLSLAGETMVSRMAGSLLHAIGLPELVTSSAQEYEEKAVYLASHPDKLRDLRVRLAVNRANLPLFDTPRFVNNLESGFRKMVARSRAGLSPESITVVETSQ